MGFLSGLGSFCTSVVSSVVSAGVELVGNVIVGVGSAVINTVKSWIFDTDDIKDAPAYDETNSTLDETMKMNELLTTKRAEYKNIVESYEKNMQQGVNKISNVLLDLLKDFNTKREVAINIEGIENTLSKLSHKTQGLLGDKIAQQLTLSNNECAEILKLQGNERIKQVDDFIKKIVRTGIDGFFQEFQDTFSDIIEYQIKHNVNIKFKEYEEKQANLKKEVELYIKSNDQDRKEQRKKVLEKKYQALEDLESRLFTK